MASALTGECMIVALGGRPLTGKTTLAQALAEAMPGVLLDKAALRRVLFPELVTASPELNDRLYEWLLQAATWQLDREPGTVIVLDGRPLTRIRDVLSLRRFAAGIGHTLHIIECVCPDTVAAQRGKQADDCEAPAGRFDEPTEPIPEPKIVVDTLLPPEQCLRLALNRITEGKASGCPETADSTPTARTVTPDSPVQRSRAAVGVTVTGAPSARSVAGSNGGRTS
ncbi:AAA family ATPase [Streptomyces sp. BE133]|uniref:AAA family ATPase n=1 Tax=Streptomyces sp. BE133 TaxID=3002523 RepID=UPI002E78E7B8|nr:AAA family ATPase [Streptomyces sp. BE133]MEE1808211.1 AAA family ATPase [Streptomyces sp. BE133]